MARIKRQSHNGGLARVEQLLAQVDGVQGKVGFFESSKYEDGTPVAYVAAIQEYGSAAAGIPPRSFMRTTIEAKREAWRASLKRGASAMVNGELSPAQFMEALAMLAAGNVAQTLARLQSPPLSPVTLQLRAWKRAGLKVGARQVGWAAALVAKGLNDQVTGAAAKPLVFEGVLFNAITAVVDDKVVFKNGGN